VFTLGMRVAAGIGICLLTPFVCAILVLVMNAAVLLFPAWAPLGGARAGIDVMGQRIFFAAGLFLAMAAALLPAALVAAAVFFLTLWMIGPVVAAGLAVVAVLTVLGSEIAVAVFFLGKRFESFDLSAELKP
jgi:hypothetical protein